MKENIFNLFYFTDGKYIDELGVVVHAVAGNDSGKQLFLQNAVANDFKKSKRFSPPLSLCNTNNSDHFTVGCYTALMRQGRTFEIFERIFEEYGATNNPICCITPIINGKPEIDIITDHSPFYLSKYQGHPKLGAGVMDDYLEKYMTSEGVDLPRLINNDYFEAIKLLFNNKQYVSCMKLLASSIDTLAFIEYGDSHNNFINWLNEYSDIKSVGITSSQLWELRNSILHMSNLDSRRVLDGKEKRISFCVAKSGYVPETDFENQYFNLMDLIEVIAQAISKWIASYNETPSKRTIFIERYDRIISDDRHAIFNIK
jgi:hypothetical protein